MPETYFEPETCDCWPEHWDALQVFLACGTQWRTIAGAKSIIYQALDYTAVYGHPRYARLDYDEQERRLAQVQEIERGALEVIND
ncbi:DUF1799 domain-containing protein [Salinicola corii]|uniref:DUF1799 domain-containing protein n=1 Tax=Salinicola corii TaxID=2606937 RepID=UPI0016590E13|nr:DUF1799 domain-containing protein [Salinicola corii]